MEQWVSPQVEHQR